MNLNQLYYFQTIARLSHFTKAATELNISQPTLSYAISSLENELETPLFEKHGRNVVLTKYGASFLEYINRGLNEIDAGVRHIQKLTSTEEGRIDIAYLYPLAPRYIPKMVRQFLSLEGNEHISFTFFQGITSSLIRGLKENKYDVIFSSMVEGEDLVEFHPILSQNLVLAVPKEHALASRTSITLKEVEAFPLVVYTAETGLGQLTKRIFAEEDIHPRIISQAENEQALYGLVSEGFGLSIVAHIPEISEYNVVPIPIDCALCERNIYVAHMKNRYQPPAVERFLTYAAEAKFEI